MQIRPENPTDIIAIRDLTIAAFEGREEEAKLVELIRESSNYLPELSLVAESDAELIGHVLFSRVTLRAEEDRQILSLAPLTVHPSHQGKGVGKALMAAGIEAVRSAGEDIVVLEGHPAYYPQFGFEQAVPLGIDKPAPGVPDEAFMVLFVDPAARGTRGKLVYPPAFHQTAAIGP